MNFFCSPSKLYSQLAIVKNYVEKSTIYLDKKGNFYYFKGSDKNIRFQANQFFRDYSIELKYLINKEFHNKRKRLLFEIEKDLGVTFKHRYRVVNELVLDKQNTDRHRVLV